MERRDRRLNLAFLASAAAAWVIVVIIVMTQDPIQVPLAGYAGAVAIGAAVGLTAVPPFWLVPFARHRRIAWRGSWTRAIRRGVWIGVLVMTFIVLRLLGLFQLPLALFVTALVVVAETTMSSDR